MKTKSLGVVLPAETCSSSPAVWRLPVFGVATTTGTASRTAAMPETAVRVRFKGLPAGIGPEGLNAAVTPAGREPGSTESESVGGVPAPGTVPLPVPVLAVVIGTVTLVPPATLAVLGFIETLKSLAS